MSIDLRDWSQIGNGLEDRVHEKTKGADELEGPARVVGAKDAQVRADGISQGAWEEEERACPAPIVVRVGHLGKGAQGEAGGSTVPPAGRAVEPPLDELEEAADEPKVRGEDVGASRNPADGGGVGRHVPAHLEEGGTEVAEGAEPEGHDDGQIPVKVVHLAGGDASFVPGGGVESAEIPTIKEYASIYHERGGRHARQHRRLDVVVVQTEAPDRNGRPDQ